MIQYIRLYFVIHRNQQKYNKNETEGAPPLN